MLGGAVSDFDAAQPSMQTVLAREAGTSTDALYLALTAGSVVVEADIYFGTADGATFAVSQLLAGIFASPAALEGALNVQFDRDGLDVAASVQRILVAPEYKTIDAVAIGIGAGVGGLAALLLVIGGVALYQMRKKISSLPSPAPGAASVGAAVEMASSDPPAQAVQAQVVQAGAAFEPQPFAVVYGDPVASDSAAASMPPLSEACETFKRELGVSGTSMVEVVDATCELLGIHSTKGDSLMYKAEKCWTIVKGQGGSGGSVAIA